MHRPLYEIAVEDAEQVMQINFLSCLWTTFAAIPYMLRQGADGEEGACIVNVSSFAATVVPTHETIYAASKGAMNGFTRGLANDLAGSGIHALLVIPGPIDTEIWDKVEDENAYSGKLYPAQLVADEILSAIEARRFEITVPKAQSPAGDGTGVRHFPARFGAAGCSENESSVTAVGARCHCPCP